MNVDHYTVEDRGHRTRCWIWQGAVTSAGYGALRHAGRVVLAHRLSYEQRVGPIAAGLTIDHLCREPLCINPRHLEAVTQRVNVRRGRHVKLTPELADRIRARVAAGETRVSIAAELGVRGWTVGRAASGVTWA